LIKSKKIPPTLAPYTGIHDKPLEEELTEHALEILIPEEATTSKTTEFLPVLTSSTFSEPKPQPFMDSYDFYPDFPCNFYDELFHDLHNVSEQRIVEEHMAQRDQGVHMRDLVEVRLKNRT
jgi:hypothetical protein